MGRSAARGVVRIAAAALLVAGLGRSAWAACAGDCNGDGVTRITELITVVNVALDAQAVSVCLAGDADQNGVIAIAEIIAAVNAALDGCTLGLACGTSTYTYTFTNYCDEAIFIGQNGPGSASTPPSFPEAGNWAVAPACTVATQATVCGGATPTCSVAAGQRLGQCVCSTDSDCPGSAPCVGGLCSTTTTFCMPQDWSSGVFWPRTGCELSDGALNCATGQCGGSPRTLASGRLDCGAASASGGQNGPTAPAIRFEPTTTSGGILNYDVSVINGYNVEMSVSVIGGSGCPLAGCTADLNTAGLATSCPADLLFADPRGSGGTVGCYQPQDACNSAGAGPLVTPPAALMCGDAITTDALGNAPASTTDCNGNSGGSVTYLDMYEAKNTADTYASGNNTQASTNAGQITAFSAADCPPDTEFTDSFIASGSCTTDADCMTAGQSCTGGGQCAVVPPPGAGVCLQFQSGQLVPEWGCTASNLGSACGQYAAQFTDALGYTCQAVTYSGGTAYPCVPSTLSGLGTCETQTNEGFYPGVGGAFNPAWVEAGIQAGGGTTAYYETFKQACPGAYVFQYDDKSADYECTISPASTNGFAINFCAGAATPSGAPTPTPTGAPPTGTPTSPGDPTATPTPAAATPTPTSGGAALTWLQGGTSSTTISLPLAGMSYTSGALTLNDSLMRFCTTSGLQPILSVAFGSQPIIGAVTVNSGQVTVANIPAATAAGTYDVTIQTNPDCGPMTTLTMPQAITYE